LKPDSEDFYEEDMKYDNGALFCPEEKTPHTDEHNGCKHFISIETEGVGSQWKQLINEI
tara:strand:- start:95 stop:271 length:177 start_codon:yes stop_codon:yes gene_type:complete